ncbi:MAG TPA: SDR family oxidoreductase [Alphaproteobacteria bacterium]|nr:SDR family oxidoreductase [Alphaproteobacteria bacterium]
MRNDGVLILGAASDVGRAVARAYAAAGRPLILAARDAARLDTDLADLKLRGSPDARAVEFDALDLGAIQPFLDGLGELPAVAVCVVGLPGDQLRSQVDLGAAELVMRSNYVGPALILAALANRMEALGSGTIVGVSSVAGERGRASNYVYGSAKAGFTQFLSGLRNRLARKGVRVITVKPGFIDTRMTAGMKLPPLLTAQAQEVARAILAAEAKGRDVIYVRPIWRWIMAAIRLLPESLFKRTKL